MNEVKVKIINEQSYGISNLLLILYDVDSGQQVNPDLSTDFSGEFAGGLSGDRIGSGISDENGLFTFEFNEAAFQGGDQEKRPDLILLVLSPETTAPDQEVPTAVPLKEQLIHVSNIPRVDSGKKESYIIKLTNGQLEKFGIPIPGKSADPAPLDPKMEAKQYISEIKNATRFKSLISEGLSEYYQKKYDQRKEVRQAIKINTQKLSAVSEEQRESTFFLAEGAGHNRLNKTMGKVVKDGIKNLQRYGAISEKHKPLIVTISEKDLIDRFKDLELSELPDSPTEISAKAFCSLLHPEGGGYDLTRVRDLLQATAREEISAGDETGDGNGDGTDGGSTEESIDIENAIQNRVLGQLNDLATFDGACEEKKDPLLRLKEALNSLQLSSGPANVTSYHDFHSLQIAFKNVWTESFDPSVKKSIEWLYDGVVVLHEDYGLSIPPVPELNEINDLYEFMEGVETAVLAIGDPAPTEVIIIWPEAADTWHLLDLSQQLALKSLARGSDLRIDVPGKGIVKASEISRTERIKTGKIILAAPRGAALRLTRLIADIGKSLSEPYDFQYFKPDTVNFGLLSTYRQEWQPGPYQVGDLVSTIPLAPGETRKFSKKEVVKRSRSIKEVEKALSSRSGESTQTRRAEADILSKANLNSNFKMTAQGSFSFGFGSSSTTTEFGLNQAQESAQTKKDFREAVIKAAYEYKNERNLEIATSDEFSAETSTSGELKNPNNELSVTYLLYELERQYRVSEKIHRLTPVILVAQDVPGPHEITETWLLTHEWILRRVLLDDALHRGLDFLTDSFAGDELSLSIKKQNWETQKELVSSLQSAVDLHLEQRDNLRALLIGTEKAKGVAKARDESEGFFDDLTDFFNGDNEELDIGILDASLKALRTQLDYLNSNLQDSQERLTRAQEAVNQATREYTNALEDSTNRKVVVDQLRIHVKENILYYMQAIWDHEPVDQRFFRLNDKAAFIPQVGTSTLRIRPVDPATDDIGTLPGIEIEGEKYIIESEALPIPEIPWGGEDSENTAKLVEIADLDNPLGYKGNYIIFPLKTCSFITDYMMREYIDNYFGIRDPDPLAEFSSEELLQYVAQVRGELSPAEREAVDRLIAKRLTSPKRESDLVIVPTGQIFMEALLGDQPLLEPFKMAHRGYDAAKARAELREQELENLRLASRLLQEEPQLDDPQIDKKVVVHGNVNAEIES